MKNIKLYEEFFYFQDIELTMDNIITTLNNNNVDYEIVSRTDKGLVISIKNVCPFYFMFTDDNHIDLLIETDFKTDSLGLFDINKDFDEMMDIVINFNIDNYYK